MLSLIALAVAISLLNVVLLAILLHRSRASQRADVEPAVREELRQGREESSKAARELRDEVAQGLKSATDTLVKAVGELGNLQKAQLDGVVDQVRTLSTTNQTAFESLRKAVDLKLSAFQESYEKGSELMRQTVEGKLQATHDQSDKAARELREELTSGLKGNADSIVKAIGEMGHLQKITLDGVALQLKGLADTTQSKLDTLRVAVDTQLREIQDSNVKKLDEMRKTVDEKLQGTLEKRLGESFKVVSDQLEAVHRGLGEMQGLASGVGDLKRVLTNEKARGTWAEYQLGAILEQILTPDQYDKNVQTRDDSREAVEFAVRLPGSGGDHANSVWLPIDSKFPQEDYLRLLDAAEAGDAETVASTTAALVRVIRVAAQDIRDKYLNPPRTTDFALLFLPTEGLYAEVLRQPGLVDQLQQTYRVVVAGPTTLAAILSSLRMGFRTLAIEQRASEVWIVLGAVKTEFAKLGEVLDRVKRQLNVASRTIDETGVRTRAMERKLRQVEELPPDAAAQLLMLEDVVDTDLGEAEAAGADDTDS